MKPVFSGRENTRENIRENVDRSPSSSSSNNVTREEAQRMANDAAERAANVAVDRALASQRRESGRESGREGERGNRSDNEDFGLSDKLTKQLQSTVGIFNTLKEFSSNPLQKAIETKVGELAAGVVENAFGRPQQKPRGMVAEFLSPILDSQFGASLGAQLGNKSPELIESMGRTFGKEKAANMIDNMLGDNRRQIGPGGLGGLGGPQPGSGSGSSSGSGQLQQLQPGSGNSGVGSKPQTEKELLLMLSPDNPEHVSAYAESQGGLPVDIARKMLMMHQDAFIKQMGIQGTDISKFTNRGQQVGGQMPVQQREVIEMPGQMPEQQMQQRQEVGEVGEVGQQGQQGQIMEVLQQFSKDMNGALGNTNSIINELYKKIGKLENDVNVLKGGKDIIIKEKQGQIMEVEENVIDTVGKVDTNKDKKRENEKGTVKAIDDGWSDEELQEAAFRMRT